MPLFSNTKDKDKKEESKTAKKQEKKQTSVKKSENKQKLAYRVLIKPLITEKGANMAQQGKYLFEIATDANKIEVAKAVEELYGIYPKAVNVIKMKGKVKRYGRYIGKRKDWKKAIVTLPKGKTINIYEGV